MIVSNCFIKMIEIHPHYILSRAKLSQMNGLILKIWID